MSAAAMSAYGARRLSRRGLATVLALHGGALWGLAQLDLIDRPAPLAVLSVSLLPAPPTATPQPKVEPPKPRPIELRPLPPPAREAAHIALPTTVPVAAPAVEVPATPPVAPAPPTAAPPAPPAPVPPRFDANYLDNPKPVYPALSRRLGEEGRVVLRVRVGANGLPLAVEVHTGSGSSRLDRAAIETVRRWQFVAARLGDQAVAAAVLVPIVFSLQE